MYRLNYLPWDGTIGGVIRLSDNANIGLSETNPDFREFLEWNKAQKTPLDLNSTIVPVKPEPVRDLAGEITELRDRVAILEK